MPLHFIKNQQEIAPESPAEARLVELCQHLREALTLEWRNGQYWLHSLTPGENPIGIEFDRTIERHLDFFKRSSLQKEVLARAIGIKGPHRPKILDLTAGLLGDSLLFLSFGCEVRAVERHPVVAFLIESALKNAQHPLVSKLQFVAADSREVLTQNMHEEVIFFDPMFEDANQKSLPKKEMRIFREMLKEDADAEDVLKLALASKAKRVVVKRPRLSAALTEMRSVEFVGKATRYDVYFPFESNPLK